MLSIELLIDFKNSILEFLFACQPIIIIFNVFFLGLDVSLPWCKRPILFSVIAITLFRTSKFVGDKFYCLTLNGSFRRDIYILLVEIFII